MPFFSIITVVYNAVETLEQTIQSVFSQSFQDFEYIIIDGGSTDGTLGIIEKYKTSIAYSVSEKDKGLYDAMNKGVRMCKGDYIAMLNADDWYEPLVLEKVALEAKKMNFPAVIAGGIQFWKDETKDKVSYSSLTNFTKKMTVYHPASFISKRVYEEVGEYSLIYKLASDYDLLMRIFLSGNEIVCLDSVFANMRVSGLSEKKWKQALNESRLIKLNYFSSIKVNLEFLDMFLKDSIVRIVTRLGLGKFYQKYKNTKSRLTGEKTFYVN